MVASYAREQVLSFRVRAQQLDRTSGTLTDTAVLDVGVQDTGPDGAMWALAQRGVDVSKLARSELVRVWTLRGAPHLYRRRDLPSVATAVAPFSESDASKRIFDAAKPLRSAGIDTVAALDAVATAMRSIVTRPMVKGEVSRQVTAVMDPPYLRHCRPCDTTHLYEMPFRLAALRAGLELEADTSPPVLRPIPGFVRAPTTPARFDVVRAYLRLLGPATPRHVADFLDAPVADVRARWPADVVEVSVEGERRWLLAADEAELAAGPAPLTRLLGPFDLFLQARDRRLLVDDAVRAKSLWPALGRPGAVLVDGEITGTWRPRKAGAQLTVQVQPWAALSPHLEATIRDEAERLAQRRRVVLAGVTLAD